MDVCQGSGWPADMGSFSDLSICSQTELGNVPWCLLERGEEGNGDHATGVVSIEYAMSLPQSYYSTSFHCIFYQKVVAGRENDIVLQSLLSDTEYKVTVTPMYFNGEGNPVSASGRTRMYGLCLWVKVQRHKLLLFIYYFSLKLLVVLKCDWLLQANIHSSLNSFT